MVIGDVQYPKIFSVQPAQTDKPGIIKVRQQVIFDLLKIAMLLFILNDFHNGCQSICWKCNSK